MLRIILNNAHDTYCSFTAKRKIILHITSSLLSDHILCKGSIVIMKKIGYDILSIRPEILIQHYNKRKFSVQYSYLKFIFYVLCMNELPPFKFIDHNFYLNSHILLEFGCNHEISTNERFILYPTDKTMGN